MGRLYILRSGPVNTRWCSSARRLFRSPVYSLVSLGGMDLVDPCKQIPTQTDPLNWLVEDMHRDSHWQVDITRLVYYNSQLQPSQRVFAFCPTEQRTSKRHRCDRFATEPRDQDVRICMAVSCGADLAGSMVCICTHAVDVDIMNFPLERCCEVVEFSYVIS